MCECQALHPDPEDDDSDNDFEGEEYDVEEAGESELQSVVLQCEINAVLTLCVFSSCLRLSVCPLWTPRLQRQVRRPQIFTLTPKVVSERPA